MTLLTLSETSDLLRVTRATVTAWMKSGKLPASVYSTRPVVRFDRDALVRFMGFEQAQERRREISQAEIIEKVNRQCSRRKA